MKSRDTASWLWEFYISITALDDILPFRKDQSHLPSCFPAFPDLPTVPAGPRQRVGRRLRTAAGAQQVPGSWARKWVRRESRMARSHGCLLLESPNVSPEVAQGPS